MCLSLGKGCFRFLAIHPSLNVKLPWTPAASHKISPHICFLDFSLVSKSFPYVVQGALGLAGQRMGGSALLSVQGLTGCLGPRQKPHAPLVGDALSSDQGFCPPGCSRHLFLIFLSYSSIHHVIKENTHTKSILFQLKPPLDCLHSSFVYKGSAVFLAREEEGEKDTHFIFNLTFYNQGLFWNN